MANAAGRFAVGMKGSKKMKALILNSGRGTRLGALTERQPKALTELENGETILGRQLRLLVQAGLRDVVITTGPFAEALEEYVRAQGLGLSYVFVPNPDYMSTNYIWSMELAREALRDTDLLLMHGDLVFAREVLGQVLDQQRSVMAVSSRLALPEKDFKAVPDGEGRIGKIGIEFFESAVAAQPLYKLRAADWQVWQESIHRFVQAGQKNCYAENAFNEIAGHCELYACDIRDMFCREIDTMEDLTEVRKERSLWRDR